MAQTCQKCGCDQLVTQLRHVKVDVGSPQTQMYAIAPAQMCSKCGNLTVTVNADIGGLAGLIPDPDVAKAAKQATERSKAPKAAKAAKKNGTTKKRR